MKLVSKIPMAMSALISLTSCNVNIKNAKTDSVKIYGNCEMCEKTIETSGTMQDIAQVDWNKDSKMATLTYDSTKTNQDEILKRIALSGYDSDKFLAPDDVYGKLAPCCQYERVNKQAMIPSTPVEEQPAPQQDTTVQTVVEKTDQLQPVFDEYFALKDALIAANGKQASAKSKGLREKVDAVKMEELTAEEHTAWMKLLPDLKVNTEKISNSTDIEKQRMAFIDLSANMYALLKVSKQDYTIYYQNCPMYNDGEGANWLSKESAIKNPYYGSQMLSCGKTIEAIK